MNTMRNDNAGHRRLWLAALAGVLASGPAIAADGAGVASRLPGVTAVQTAIALTPEQRLREELRVLLMDMIQSGAFGATAPDRIQLALDEPARRVSDLGVLVDSASGERARDGLHVVATTPGGSAQRMGLRGGDVLLAVNDVALNGLGDETGGGARAAAVLRGQVDALGDGATLRFRVLRAGRTLDVAGPLASVWMPAMSLRLGDGVALAANGAMPVGGCGRVSIVDVAPRQQGLHAAGVISIDGALAGTRDQQVFRLTPGTHTLQIGERIESRYLSFNDRQRSAGKVYKTLTIDIAPDTTYYVAAHLDDAQRNAWADGAYWEPVVWKQGAEACR